jgi:TonB family protein
LEGRVRGIDFAAGDAAEVTLDRGAVMRVLEVGDAWKIVTWESHPGAIEPAEKIEDVLPVFPLDAQRARPDQVVVLQALIDHAGAVRHLEVVTSVPELDEPALAAARQWRFRPARRKGVPVPLVMTLTVGFVGEAP